MTEQGKCPECFGTGSIGAQMCMCGELPLANVHSLEHAYQEAQVNCPTCKGSGEAARIVYGQRGQCQKCGCFYGHHEPTCPDADEVQRASAPTPPVSGMEGEAQAPRTTLPVIPEGNPTPGLATTPPEASQRPKRESNPLSREEIEEFRMKAYHKYCAGKPSRKSAGNRFEIEDLICDMALRCVDAEDKQELYKCEMDELLDKVKSLESKLAQAKEALEKISRLQLESIRNIGDYSEIAAHALSQMDEK